jgi:hypothetical protein
MVMGSKVDDPATATEMMEHGWRYFSLHAAQRMSVFNFFVVLSGVVLAGLAATLQAERHLAAIGAALGFTLIVVAFLFWRLDSRTSSLIKNAEAALATLEQRFGVPAARLVQIDRDTPERWTYGRALRIVYSCMALAGLVGASLSLARVARWISW